LGAGETIVRQQDGFNAFDVLGGLAARGHEGFFFHPLDSVDGSQAVPFGEQRQTFNDRLLGVMPAIEHGSDRFDKGAVTGATLIALGAGLGMAKPADVAVSDLPIISTARIPAERAGMHEGGLFHYRPSSLLVHRS
jgi:hypothetical protein